MSRRSREIVFLALQNETRTSSNNVSLNSVQRELESQKKIQKGKVTVLSNSTLVPPKIPEQENSNDVMKGKLEGQVQIETYQHSATCESSSINDPYHFPSESDETRSLDIISETSYSDIDDQNLESDIVIPVCSPILYETKQLYISRQDSCSQDIVQPEVNILNKQKCLKELVENEFKTSYENKPTDVAHHVSSPDIISETDDEDNFSETDKDLKLKTDDANFEYLPSTSGTSKIPSSPNNSILYFESDDDDSFNDPDFVPSDIEDVSSEFEANDENITEESQASEKSVVESSEQLVTKQAVKIQVEKPGKGNYKDKKDYCFFCEKDVLHFGRHIQTWHLGEIDVQRILTFPPNSKEKRAAIALLRKQGNFLKNRGSNQVRPVKRASKTSSQLASDYLPCQHCLGIYARQFLYRHTKRCERNPQKDKKMNRQTSQSDGHTALLLGSLVKYDELLKKELFPRMRADKINAIAKTDFLICNYAYSYLKGRRSKGNLDFVRQNIRKLAKLLQIASAKNNSIKELIDVLSPCHFKLIVDGVNEIASYDSETETYKSPTLAVNFGTLLKKCCDLAYIHLVQLRNTDKKQKEVQVLKTLIESQWANEVSAQAGANLNTQKWNKNELVPLTADLKILNEFLQRLADESYTSLQEKRDDQSIYNTLKEVLYCQIILLNRRRPGEVAQLKVHTYRSINLAPNTHNEFETCLTETEKILLNTYSRFVIRGKRGRGVPVLLSPAMKTHFDFLIKIRENFIINNPYVFHTNGVTFLDGTKTLHKYVKKSGIKKVHSITATRLRKHLATVTQLLNFSERDLEQLSNFMGHSLKTHLSFYRLPDSLYQTAKVSKLLLLISQGGAEQYKGMQLDDINVDLEPMVIEEQPLEPLTQDSEDENNEKEMENEIQSRKEVQKLKRLQNKAPAQRYMWTKQEKRIVSQYFEHHINRKQSPKKHEIDTFLEAYPMFRGKRWTSVKALVYNIYCGKLKIT